MHITPSHFQYLQRKLTLSAEGCEKKPFRVKLCTFSILQSEGRTSDCRKKNRNTFFTGGWLLRIMLKFLTLATYSLFLFKLFCFISISPWEGVLQKKKTVFSVRKKNNQLWFVSSLVHKCWQQKQQLCRQILTQRWQYGEFVLQIEFSCWALGLCDFTCVSECVCVCVCVCVYVHALTRMCVSSFPGKSPCPSGGSTWTPYGEAND